LSVSAPLQQSILLVEDQENDTILIKLALARAGLKQKVVGVASGLEAMAYLSGDPPFQDRSRYPEPAMVLLDIRMPAVDGFEVLRWIRHQAKFNDLPVVMLTGSDTIQDANTAYSLGANSFMVKSIDFHDAHQLSRSIEQLIAKRHG
jgi:CheY-like chemotaxis protein